jgi:outer membrane protein TolC
MEQRQVLEALAKRAQRLFEIRTLTTYDKAQTEANLENIKNQEQIAWNNFIASSNILVELLNYKPGMLILPAGYSEDLLASEGKPPIPIEPKEAFDIAMERRPEIKASQIAIESNDILVKHRQTQIRPDLNLTAGVILNQSNAVLGYASWEDSFSNVFSPDSSNFFVGVSFRIPFGNLAARSALSQARIGRNQAMDQSQQTINFVTQEINTVISDAYSTHARIKQSKASLDLAQLAYDKANLLQEQGLVTEFELLRKLSELLAARSVYIDTLVDYRRTKARLLSAEGVLAAQY